MTLDLLAIAAHPDDVELTCGGTLLKSAQQGYKTGILDLTAGEMGTRGTPETRAKEAARAAKILKVSYRGTLGVPDFLFVLGARIIRGARNPVCRANSASALPEGRRQLIGSIHSMGIWGIRMGEFRRPGPDGRWLAF